MTRFPARLAAAAAAALLPLLLQAPARAHAVAGGGAIPGLLHPLLGVDHLLMLLAVGAAAAVLSPVLLPWALAGAVSGALFGGAGLHLPGVEGLAALAVLAVAGWTGLVSRLAAHRRGGWPLEHLSGALVAVALMLHGLLHGLEAPTGAGSLAWWAGALLASTVVCAGTTLLLRRLGIRPSLPAIPQGLSGPSR